MTIQCQITANFITNVIVARSKLNNYISSLKQNKINAIQAMTISKYHALTH